MLTSDCATPMNALEPRSLFHYLFPPAASPASLSLLGLSLARNKGDFFQSIALCREAIRRDPEDPLHYLHLGKIYLLARKKHLALHTFRKGLKYGDHRGLIREIERLGFRHPPVFPFLGRKHPLNRFAGIFFSHLGWR